jgi:hypothetical protein
MSRRRALLVGLALAALDAFAVAVFWEVQRARHAVLGARGVPAWPIYGLWEHFEAQAKALYLGGGVLFLLGLLSAIAGVVWARRRAAGAVVALTLVTPAAILGVAGLGVLRCAHAYLRFGDPCADPSFVEQYRYETFSSHTVSLQAARLVILALAVLSTAAVLTFVRRGRGPSAPRIAAPVMVFVAGLAAFAFTRAEAHDERSPMPLRPGTERAPSSDAHALLLPGARGCEPLLDDGPLLAWDGGRWTLDGVETSDPAQVATALGWKRNLWQQIHPGEPFPGVMVAAIPASTPLDVVRPMLSAVRAQGFPTVDVVEVLPVEHWPTSTLGDVPYHPRSCRVRLAADQALPSARTWGELAAALSRVP